jgi:hypothetical protein
MTILAGGHVMKLGRFLSLLVVLELVTLAVAPVAARLQFVEPPKQVEDDETGYLCPMHPDFTSDMPGKCALCGMNLVVGALYDMRDYKLEFTTVPAVPQAGENLRLNFNVVHPGTGERIKKFEAVHDKFYHLFVISQDMEFFQHIHPEQTEEGTWTIDVVLPKPGYYAVLSDFLPSGGSSQFLTLPLVTAGYNGDLMAGSANLTLDTVQTQTVDDLKATVTYDPGTLQAGSYGHVTFYLTNPQTDQPINELQTYLGAFGHMLIMSEDMIDYVHSHPVDTPSPELGNPEDLRGGPTVMFEGLMPKPGRYRAWAQFRYRDKIHTFTNTFEVFEIGQRAAR